MLYEGWHVHNICTFMAPTYAVNKEKWKKGCGCLCWLCVCVCVYIYIYTHICIYIYVCVCIYIYIYIYEVVFLPEIVSLSIPWRVSLVMNPTSNDVQFLVQLKAVKVFICWPAIVCYGVLRYVDPVTSAVDGRRLLNIANKRIRRSRWSDACLRPHDEDMDVCRIWMSVTGRSFIQRSPTKCGASECDLETSTVRTPRPIRAV
jgi:hypothetical protein